MSASVFAFPSRGKGPQPWTNDELAELYRVVDLLGRAGLTVTTDMGMSDEGDPWFVFCRTDNDEVIAHFARIDGVFVAASIAVDETFRGANFRQIVDRMVSSQPLVMPRPNSGSKLFLHPAVMLTAFVATALAHSQKAQALDWLHAVEAQWGHGKAALLGEVRHIKTGWFDTLNTLLKLPLHDDKLTHDSSKDSVMTLASLIAIALAALQPIAEKMAVISHLVSEEFSAHSAGPAQEARVHAMQAALDGPGMDFSAAGDAHHTSAQAQHAAVDAPQIHKVAGAVAVAGDAGGDGQKAIIDAAHALSIPMVQKVPVAAVDEVVHAATISLDSPADANVAFILAQQKAAAAATVASASSVETYVIVTQASTASSPAINMQDVTPQAVQALSIHSTKPDPTLTDGETDSSSSHTSSSTPSQTETSPSTASQLTASQPTTPPVQVVSQPVNQYVDDLHSSLTTVVTAISDFVNDDSHIVAQAPSLTLSAANQEKLDGFFAQSNSQSLKVVFFDSTVASEPDMFLFSTGVVFIEEKDISPNLQVTNNGGTLTMLVEGGTVTLVGVATIEQHTHTAAV